MAQNSTKALLNAFVTATFGRGKGGNAYIQVHIPGVGERFLYSPASTMLECAKSLSNAELRIALMHCRDQFKKFQTKGHEDDLPPIYCDLMNQLEEIAKIRNLGWVPTMEEHKRLANLTWDLPAPKPKP
ncbi:MAG: hypothetical protein KGI60_00525 [Patescibacteria group bacterium]|nr:hypothetical protein [Patescibacteria group bacterium]